MPKGKDIYEDLSKKYFERRRAREALSKAADVDEDGKPIPPAKIDNFRVNKPKMARSLNFQPGEPKRRKISPTEGKPVVNASTDIKKLIHKPKAVAKTPLENPTAGVIKDTEGAPKKRGRPKGSKNKTTKKATRRKNDGTKQARKRTSK